MMADVCEVDIREMDVENLENVSNVEVLLNDTMYENIRIFSEHLSDTPVMENLSINEEIQIFTIKSPPKTRFAINFSDTDNDNTDKNIILQSHSQSNGDEISKVKATGAQLKSTFMKV